jgi:hypothetical protein
MLLLSMHMLVYHRHLVVRLVPGLLPIEPAQAVVTFFLQGLLSPEQGKVYASACSKRRSLPTLIRVVGFFCFLSSFWNFYFFFRRGLRLLCRPCCERSTYL